MNTTCMREQQAAADRLATFARMSWRRALAGLTQPALRLHRYRRLRTQLMWRVPADDGGE